jgi:hypothetical protein
MLMYSAFLAYRVLAYGEPMWNSKLIWSEGKAVWWRKSWWAWNWESLNPMLIFPVHLKKVKVSLEGKWTQALLRSLLLENVFFCPSYLTCNFISYHPTENNVKSGLRMFVLSLINYHQPHGVLATSWPLNCRYVAAYAVCPCTSQCYTSCE